MVAWFIPISFQVMLCMNFKNTTVQKKKNVSEGIDVNKINASKKCMLCHYWCFKEVGFKLEQHVCNKYQGVWMTACDLTHIAILSVGGADFRCIL